MIHQPCFHCKDRENKIQREKSPSSKLSLKEKASPELRLLGAKIQIHKEPVLLVSQPHQIKS